MRSHVRTLVLMLLAIQLCACFTKLSLPEDSGEAYQSQLGWIVNAQRAAELHQAGARYLDARDLADWEFEHVEGSLPVRWEDFSETEASQRGRLLSDDALLQQRLRALGISNDQAVVVVGQPVGGWGEDGRIAWMLKTLGHPQVYLLDGGAGVFAQGELPLTSVATASPSEGNFVVSRVDTWDIQQDQLKVLVDQGAIGSGQTRLVDAREQREYEGDTPYGETRGGHVPGAVHLHYEDLLRATGTLRSRPDITRRLLELGVSINSDAIAYCSGGVRSGWLVFLLADLGIRSAKNYAGSMWEWSASSASAYPLE